MLRDHSNLLFGEFIFIISQRFTGAAHTFGGYDVHSDLKQWLKWTWERREEVLAKAPDRARGFAHTVDQDKNDAVNFIYHYYSGDSDVSHAKQADVVRFMDELVRTMTMLNIQNVRRQDSGKKGWAVLTRDEIGWERVFPEKSAGKYFHIKRRDTDLASHRVYVNLKEVDRGAVFRELLKAIWNVRELRTAKVLAPGDGDCADNVVIYCNSARGRDAVEENIQEQFYPYFKNYLRPELPKLLRPSKTMRGVGFGMQPPSNQLMRHNGRFYVQKHSQSFGMYRAQIIFMALERTPEPSWYNKRKMYKDFAGRVAQYFAVAGIDVNNPEKQYDQGRVLQFNALQQAITHEAKTRKAANDALANLKKVHAF